jgi:hypothetical protein
MHAADRRNCGARRAKIDKVGRHLNVGDWPILLKNSPVETVKAH